MTKTRNVMKKMISIWTFALTIVLIAIVDVDTLAQEQPAHVASQGGGISNGGNYTQFSVIGGEPVDANISGGNFSGQAGFLTEVLKFFYCAMLSAEILLRRKVIH